MTGQTFSSAGSAGASGWPVRRPTAPWRSSRSRPGRARAAPWHVHRRDDETFYVLEGAIDLHVGDRTERVAAGGLAHAPKGIPHTITVVSEQARWLVVCTPAGFERFAVEAAADPSRVAALAQEHGLQILDG